MSLIRPSFTRSAIFSAKRALFTWYGNSVTTIRGTAVRALLHLRDRTRTLMEPRPVS